MKMFRNAATGLFLAFLALTCARAAGAATNEDTAVYHITDSAAAMGALGNVRNHLNASPHAKIVVVANGAGIDFLLDGAKDKNGNPYDAVIDELTSRKVQFRVCNNTLEARKIDKKRVLPDATIVPAGVAEVSRLQHEGYAYIKP